MTLPLTPETDSRCRWTVINKKKKKKKSPVFVFVVVELFCLFLCPQKVFFIRDLDISFFFFLDASSLVVFSVAVYLCVVRHRIVCSS